MTKCNFLASALLGCCVIAMFSLVYAAFELQVSAAMAHVAFDVYYQDGLKKHCQRYPDFHLCTDLGKSGISNYERWIVEHFGDQKTD